MKIQGHAHLQLPPFPVDWSDFDVHGAIDNDQVWILLYLFACKYNAAIVIIMIIHNHRTATGPKRLNVHSCQRWKHTTTLNMVIIAIILDIDIILICIVLLCLLYLFSLL